VSAVEHSALELFAPLAASYDRMGRLLGLGQDGRWRAAMVEAVQASSSERVLDVATGTGLVAEALVRRYGCTVLALDQSAPMLGAAAERLAQDRLLGARVSLIEAQAQALPFADAAFDHLTFTYLLRYVEDAATTIAELVRVVKPGGRIASLEFGVPSAQPWRALWHLYARYGLPVLGRLGSREWAATGHFLAHSIPALYERHPLNELVSMWEQAGVESVKVRLMSRGAGVVMWGTRASPDARRVEDAGEP
jgi:demethylmenaquinone methyltransferase / 2-methoxy-6-polyprenyl-1,4-benzoquinol methylase